MHSHLYNYIQYVSRKRQGGRQTDRQTKTGRISH